MGSVEIDGSDDTDGLSDGAAEIEGSTVERLGA